MSLKLYAIRDRLIGYFMQPFPGPSDHQVKAAVAANVNEGGSHAIHQAPHQFELWRLAGIDEETGKVTADPEYLCDLSSLVRGSVRRGGIAREGEIQGPEGHSHEAAGGPPGTANANERPPQGPAPAENRERTETHPGPR